MNANDYKQLAVRQTSTKIFDVEMPSGAIWKLRHPPVQQYIMSGRLPVNLSNKMAMLVKSGDIGDAEKTLSQLSGEEIRLMLNFSRELLLYCAVEPRITLEEQDDSLTPEQILPEDFEFLLNWVMSGGKAGESLNTFRPERQ